MSGAMTHSEKNRQVFDKRASSYDSEPWQALLSRITEELRTHVDWIGVPWVENGASGRQVRILDYACGPGVASRAFLPYVTQVRGIDVSGAMVEEYNRRAKDQGLEPKIMHATRGDLTDTSGSAECAIDGPDFFDFDLAVVSMAFHHFESPALVARKLVERLKLGAGVLLILDLAEDSLSHLGHGHAHGHDHGNGQQHTHSDRDGQSSHDRGDTAAGEAQNSSGSDVLGTIAHSGFGKDGLTKIFREVGLVDIDYITLERPVKLGGGGPWAGQEKTLFMARGRRAGTPHSEL